MIDITEVTNVLTSYDSIISRLLSKYELNEEPIEVSFRSIVNNLKPDRVTHLIHTYPAKLLMHIPHFFLNNDIFSKKGDTVLDPFSGSGTVMLEAILAGRNAIGADSNPLARLISKVKVKQYDCSELERLTSNLIRFIETYRLKTKPFVVNVDYWFSHDIQCQLSEIFYAIDSIVDVNIKDFFLVCFSNCVKKVSYADQRVSVPVKLNPSRYPQSHPLYNESKKKLENLENVNVLERFKEVIFDNILRVKCLNELVIDPFTANIVSDDARQLNNPKEEFSYKVPDNSVSLVITSPPYAGAQKYIRASSLSLGWLNLIKSHTTLKELDNQNIGRENYQKADYLNLKKTNITAADMLLEKIHQVNPLRAHIAANYLIEMREALTESVRALKHGGYFVLVVGNNQVCGFEFETQEYLRQILENLGLNPVLRLIDDIQSYGLMTKRNKTANIITREWVLVFRK